MLHYDNTAALIYDIRLWYYSHDATTQYQNATLQTHDHAAAQPDNTVHCSYDMMIGKRNKQHWDT